MRDEQIIRLDRSKREKIFLLEKNLEPHRCIFNICGTTKNVYNISVYFGSGKIFCNCPDGRGQCKRIGVFCKHICFLITKVFSKLFEYTRVFDILLLNTDEINKIQDFVEKDLQFDESCMDKSVLQKFLNTKKSLESEETKITIDMLKDMECPICYDEFETTDVLTCGVCNKSFHNPCINIWLQNSHNKSCPYCRSVIQKPSTGYYVNLE